MRLAFRTNRLQQAFEESNRATRTWGAEVARKYIQRVNALQDAPGFEAVKAIAALRAHALTGRRAGQWAITLTGRWRLIVTVSSDGKEVEIREVTNHYGD